MKALLIHARGKYISKVSLLTEDLRQQVNRRLQTNDNSAALVEWLNGLPEAQAALDEASCDPTVNLEDISNWKQGGYRDWLAHQTAMVEVGRVVAEAKALNQAADGALTDRLASWVAGRYTIAARQLAGENGNGTLGWNLLRALCHDLVDLRRGDHSAAWLQIERERLEMDRAEQKESLEKRFWDWAEKNRGKICQSISLTAEEKERRMREIFGMSNEDETVDSSNNGAPGPLENKGARAEASPRT